MANPQAKWYAIAFIVIVIIIILIITLWSSFVGKLENDKSTKEKKKQDQKTTKQKKKSSGK